MLEIPILGILVSRWRAMPLQHEFVTNTMVPDTVYGMGIGHTSILT